MSLLDRIANFDRWLFSQAPWWLGPAAMLFIGVSATFAAFAFAPSNHEWVYIAGYRFGEECASYTVFQAPCPQCGMTRSWVNAARGNLTAAVRYNVAGVLMLLWLQAMGVLGAYRLIRRDNNALTLPFSWVASAGIAWLLIYGGAWGLRVNGYNPLPELPSPPSASEADVGRK